MTRPLSFDHLQAILRQHTAGPHSPEFSGWGVQAHTDSLPT